MSENMSTYCRFYHSSAGLDFLASLTRHTIATVRVKVSKRFARVRRGQATAKQRSKV
jgi:hypothetical protein